MSSDLPLDCPFNSHDRSKRALRDMYRWATVYDERARRYSQEPAWPVELPEQVSFQPADILFQSRYTCEQILKQALGSVIAERFHRLTHEPLRHFARWNEDIQQTHWRGRSWDDLVEAARTFAKAERLKDQYLKNLDRLKEAADELRNLAEHVEDQQVNEHFGLASPLNGDELALWLEVKSIGAQERRWQWVQTLKERLGWSNDRVVKAKKGLLSKGYRWEGTYLDGG
ncbi:MAG: hypothetical protein R6V05_00415 [Candidatus Brocadiia bacterium]